MSMDDVASISPARVAPAAPPVPASSSRVTSFCRSPRPSTSSAPAPAESGSTYISPSKRASGFKRSMTQGLSVTMTNQLSTAASHNGPKIKHVGKRPSGLSGAVIPFLLSLSPTGLLVFSAITYVSFSMVFGIFFFLLGEDCFSLPPEGWSFGSAFWLSVHTFSTVGYGSIYPTVTDKRTRRLTKQRRSSA